MNLLIIVVFVLFILVVLLKSALEFTGINENSAKLVSKKPLTEIEQIAFWKLKEAAGIERVVLCQVSFSSFLKAEKTGKEGYSKFSTVKQKVADFVICNKDFSIFAIVEIDDKTHDVNKDMKRDKVTSDAGIKTFRFQARTLPSVERIKKGMML